MRILILLILFLVSPVVNADLIFHAVALHMKSETKGNLITNKYAVHGLGYKIEDKIIGAYRNSIDNISFYAVKEKEMKKNLSISYGIVTGYFHKINPLLTGNFKYKLIIVSVAPPTPESPLTMLLSFEFKFGEK